MHFIKIFIMIIIIIVVGGCTNNRKLEIIDKNIQLCNEHEVISISELDEIYNCGFNGKKLFAYLCDKNIKK